jgi:hypothetical protein
VVLPVNLKSKNYYLGRKKSLCLPLDPTKTNNFLSGMNNVRSDTIINSLLDKTKRKSNGARLRKKKVRFLTQFTDLKTKENYNLNQKTESNNPPSQNKKNNRMKLKKITSLSQYRLNSIPEYKLFYFKNSVNSEYLSDQINKEEN